jgi:hypothetical protein
MVRSLRIASLAMFAALALAAWGCGSSSTRPPGGNTDGGTGGDGGPHIQLDGPVTQLDGPVTGGDGGGGTCGHASGTELQGGTCAADTDCKCPNFCFQIDATQYAGGCQATCDTAQTDQNTGENPTCPTPASQLCEPLNAGDAMGYCLNVGTLSGNFDAKMFVTTQPSSAADYTVLSPPVSLQIGNINKQFGIAIAGKETTATPNYYYIIIYGGTSTSTVDDSNVLFMIFEADPKYANGASYDLLNQTDFGLMQLTYEKLTWGSGSPAPLTKDVMAARAMGGTVTLTTAGSADGTNLTGSFDQTIMIELETEMCGPDAPSTGC